MRAIEHITQICFVNYKITSWRQWDSLSYGMTVTRNEQVKEAAGGLLWGLVIRASGYSQRVCVCVCVCVCVK
jgi:hypothetical protein